MFDTCCYFRNVLVSSASYRIFYPAHYIVFNKMPTVLGIIISIRLTGIKADYCCSQTSALGFSRSFRRNIPMYPNSHIANYYFRQFIFGGYVTSTMVMNLTIFFIEGWIQVLLKDLNILFLCIIHKNIYRL